ncbi:MAG: cation diffusion facilitator family transporter [Deltaproteobacteria bacterium]|nr:cation diffusion facilitator family transporter [Deltaproteobacteria bacterium]
MSAEGHSSKIVLTSFAVNLAIALAKGVAAFVSGSGSMLAEAIHSAADSLNQVLLLIGLRQAAQAPSEKHPLGTGRASYFWSFLVALMLFFGGGVFSIGEGFEKIFHPTPVDHISLGLTVLVFSFALEGMALLQCFRQIDSKRGSSTRWEYLKQTKDAELVVVTGENFAAVIGLTFAVACVLAAKYVDPRFDGVGGILVGGVLVAVAVGLAYKVKGLLLGERADPEIAAQVDEAAKSDPRIAKVLRLITVQQGPGEVLIAAKLRFVEGISGQELTESINAFEQRVHQREPEVKWLFVEPDFTA